jgi:hypothetical protein
MYGGVAHGAHYNQVVLRVAAALASGLFVVDLEIGHSTARLASPAISPQDFLSKLFIVIPVEPHASLLL